MTFGVIFSIYEVEKMPVNNKLKPPLLLGIEGDTTKIAAYAMSHRIHQCAIFINGEPPEPSFCVV